MENRNPVRTDEELREQAEARLAGRSEPGDDDLPLKLLHELQVHRVELELQNEELRETRSELESALSRYLDFYHLSPVVFMTLEQGSFIREANVTAHRLLGVEHPLLLGRRLRDFIVPEDQAQFSACLAHALESRDGGVFEGSVTTPQRIARMRMELFNVDTGGMCRVVALDVTAARQFERELSKERARLRQVIDACPSLVAIQDAEGRLVLGNAALAAYCGIAPDEMPGHLAPAFPRPVPPGGVADPAEVARLQCVQRPDGSTHFFATHETRLVDAQGNADGTLVVATDVTDLRQAEAALREAEQVKKGLLAMLGYDMRGLPEARPVHPAAAVGGGASHRIGGFPRLAAQVRQLAATVDTLLGDAGGLPLEPCADSALDAVVAHAAETAALLADAGQPRPDVALPGEAVRVPGDPVRLTQVFVTLLCHAMRVAPEGRAIAVRASLRTRSDGEDVEVRIGADLGEDEARGSDKAEQGADAAGLGLVRRLVALQGGALEVLGAGAFVVRLPVLAEASH